MATAAKQITVQWQPARPDGFQLGPWMKVVESTHPQHTAGSNFDFGFFQIVTAQGYTIISLPIKA